MPPSQGGLASACGISDSPAQTAEEESVEQPCPSAAAFEAGKRRRVRARSGGSFGVLFACRCGVPIPCRLTPLVTLLPSKAAKPTRAAADPLSGLFGRYACRSTGVYPGDLLRVAVGRPFFPA